MSDKVKLVQAYFGSPLVQAAKKVYQRDRTGSPGEGDQSEHDPALTKGPPAQKEPEIWNFEERAQKLLAYANSIKQEKGCDFFKAWILASEQHPELIGTSDGMSKTAKVAETAVLPGTSAVSASYKDIGMVRFR
jgi:hypothetical protein